MGASSEPLTETDLRGLKVGDCIRIGAYIGDRAGVWYVIDELQGEYRTALGALAISFHAHAAGHPNIGYSASLYGPDRDGVAGHRRDAIRHATRTGRIAA